MSNMLINEHPLMFSPTLAIELGSIEHAVFLQQLHFWLGVSQFEHDGKKWVFNNIDQCVEMVKGTIKKRTIERIISDLKKRDIIVVEKLHSNKWRKTNYFTINYKSLNNLDGKYSSNVSTPDTAKMAVSITPKWRIPLRQNGGFDTVKMAECLQKNTTEEYNRIFKAIFDFVLKKSKAPNRELMFDQFWKTVPNKDGRKAAFKSFKSAIKLISLEDLIAAYQANVRICDQQNRFKKNPSTWLNQECWNDESIQAEITRIKNPVASQATTAEQSQKFTDDRGDW